MEENFIKVSGNVRQWVHYKNPSVRMVFEDLLLSAVCGYDLPEGYAASTVSDIQVNTGLSKPTVLKAIRALTESGDITIIGHGAMRAIHINNLDLSFPERGKNILPSGQIILPTGKNFLPSGKNILPQDTGNVQEEKEEYYIDNTATNAHAHAREGFVAEALTDLRVEQGCMALSITPEQYRQLVNDVINEWNFRGIPDNEWTMTHLLAQMRIKNNILKREQNGQQQRYIADPVARRNYERGQRIQAVAARAAALGAKSDEPPKSLF